MAGARVDPCLINPGLLRHAIQIMQPSTARDANGELLPPTLFATRYASIDGMGGQQYYKAQQFTSDADSEIVIRYLAGVAANMTVLFRGRTFIILYVVNVQERNIKTILYCKEVL